MTVRSSTIGKPAAALAIGATVYFPTAAIAAQIVSSQYDFVRDHISGYAVGSNGWIYGSALLASCIVCLALAAAPWGTVPRNSLSMPGVVLLTTVSPRLKLALEPLHPVYGGDRSCLVTMRDAVDLCEAIGHANVGVAVDVYHVWWDTTLGVELERAGAGRILGYHLCDWLAETHDVLVDRGMMGDGVADLKAIRAAVEAACYRGLCEVEIFSAANWWKRDPAEVLDACVERFRTVC